jgi:signal transduction histidine kinase
VAVETRCNDREAWISVENGGHALSQEQLAQITEPLTASSTKPEGELGLLVAREIAVAHAGSLRAESPPGRTRLILSLPLVPVKAAIAG